MSLNNDVNRVEPAAPENEVEGLRRLVEEQRKLIEQLQERIKQLEAELRKKKKLKGKPRLSASTLNQIPKELIAGKRAGSEKASKKVGFEVDETRKIELESIPDNAKFNGYREYDVQEVIIQRNNIRFKLAEYITEDGKTIAAELPKEYQGRHFGPGLICYVMYQHYQCRVPQSLIHEQLREWGVDMSAGQVNRLLNEEHEKFKREQEEVLKVGLETAMYVHTDDTGARHQGKNGYCTVIGNENFAYYKSSDSKSRVNFLEILQGGDKKYVLNERAQAYLEDHKIAKKYQEKINFSDEILASDEEEWIKYLLEKGIVGSMTVQKTSEAALLGGLNIEGRVEPLRILSDGARQFNVLEHGLCWVHMERLLRKLEGRNDKQRDNIEEMQSMLWDYYQELKKYKQEPTKEYRAKLLAEFDKIFGRKYQKHGSLNEVLQNIKSHKDELLQVLNCPDFPLHNNAAENDIREYVTKRKISGGTRSELGRIARDTFIGIKKTCRKLGVSFWNYLTSRLHEDEKVPNLSDVIRDKIAATVNTPAPT
jgi:uncharacterized coiled-coil protein SlyX